MTDGQDRSELDGEEAFCQAACSLGGKKQTRESKQEKVFRLPPVFPTRLVVGNKSNKIDKILRTPSSKARKKRERKEKEKANTS